MPDSQISSTTTPSPSSNQEFTLSERINAATRPTHSQLNRLIVARLPLALPPHSSNPADYLTGLIHIASIYSAYEQLWQTMLDTPLLPTTVLEDLPSPDTCDPDHPLFDDSTNIALVQHKPHLCTRIHSLLTHLHLPGLLRSGRIRSDIRVLSGLSDKEMDERVERAAAQDGPLADFVAHIRQSVETNPHVILAYAWVLYMALFSGGRFLRHSLHAAGPAFWSQPPGPPRPCQPNPSASTLLTPDPRRRPPLELPRKTEHRCRNASSSDNLHRTKTAPSSSPRRLSRSDHAIAAAPPAPLPGLDFFGFSGAHDGEDIKAEFKRRTAEAESLLTPSEQHDIVREAQAIFDHMIALVRQLDDTCHHHAPGGAGAAASPRDDSDSSASTEESSGSVIKRPWDRSHDDSSADSMPDAATHIGRGTARNLPGAPASRTHDPRHIHGIVNSRDSVSLNHDRIRKRHTDTFLRKGDGAALLPATDVVPPPPPPPMRATAIAFTGAARERQKSNFALLAEPLEKMVRWGGFEMVGRKASVQIDGARGRVAKVAGEEARWERKMVVLVLVALGVVVLGAGVSAWSASVAR